MLQRNEPAIRQEKRRHQDEMGHYDLGAVYASDVPLWRTSNKIESISIPDAKHSTAASMIPPYVLHEALSLLHTHTLDAVEKETGITRQVLYQILEIARSIGRETRRQLFNVPDDNNVLKFDYSDKEIKEFTYDGKIIRSFLRNSSRCKIKSDRLKDLCKAWNMCDLSREEYNLLSSRTAMETFLRCMNELYIKPKQLEVIQPYNINKGSETWHQELEYFLLNETDVAVTEGRLPLLYGTNNPHQRLAITIYHEVKDYRARFRRMNRILFALSCWYRLQKQFNASL